MSSGLVKRSRSVMACALAPAMTPLCAIGVAIEIALAQLWPGKLGMFDGYHKTMVGTFQEMSPISSEGPPLKDSSVPPPRRGLMAVSRPTSGTFSSCWMPLASAMSAADHVGSPTAWIFRYSASAIGLFIQAGHAEPRMVLEKVVLLMSAAP